MRFFKGFVDRLKRFYAGALPEESGTGNYPAVTSKMGKWLALIVAFVLVVTAVVIYQETRSEPKSGSTTGDALAGGRKFEGAARAENTPAGNVPTALGSGSGVTASVVEDGQVIQMLRDERQTYLYQLNHTNDVDGTWGQVLTRSGRIWATVRHGSEASVRLELAQLREIRDLAKKAADRQNTPAYHGQSLLRVERIDEIIWSRLDETPSNIRRKEAESELQYTRKLITEYSNPEVTDTWRELFGRLKQKFQKLLTEREAKVATW